jgi:YidC/Oxa1 family membrane protein insertase
MQSGRFLLAVVLMIATVVIVNVIFPPVRPPVTLPGADSLGISADSGAVPAAPIQPPGVSPSPAVPPPAASLTPASSPAAGARVDTIVVQSPLYRYGISTHGAALVSAELLPYQSFTRTDVEGNRAPVQLAAHGPRGLISHRLQIDGRIINLATVSFRPDRSRDLVLRDNDQPAALRFLGTDSASGQTVELTYTFQPNNYVMDVAARVQPGGRSMQLLLDFGPTIAVNEANAVEDHRALAYAVNNTRDGINSVPLQSIRTRRDRETGRLIVDQRTEPGPLSWIALKNKYFLVAAIPVQAGGDPAFGGLVATDRPGKWMVDLTATLAIGAEQQAAYRLYAGPQEYDRQVALGLQDVNPVGWRWLRPVIRPLGHAFTWILLESHRATGLAYGWVLILFGIAVRLVLWPLNAKAMRSQMKNMELQPRIKDIQTRHKQNPELMQKEMLKLYREEGFNPMGGCLPLLLPMPVLITLFFVFQSTIEFRGVGFLWLPDLSRADPLYILPALLGITMFVQQWLSSKVTPPNPQMQMMMWFMPAFMVILFLNFASGLNLYYTAQNFASFPQQLMLNRERLRYQASKGIKTVGIARG